VIAFNEISVVIPADPTEQGYFHYDRLAKSIQGQFSGRVSLIENQGEVPKTGIVLMDRYGVPTIGRGHMTLEQVVEALEQRWLPEERARILCMNLSRDSETLILVERLRLAGAVDDHDYDVGMDPSRMGTDISSLSGLYGLAAAVEKRYGKG
jgi:hypothetical protein